MPPASNVCRKEARYIPARGKEWILRVLLQLLNNSDSQHRMRLAKIL
jgi:hypothetical protein